MIFKPERPRRIVIAYIALAAAAIGMTFFLQSLPEVNEEPLAGNILKSVAVLLLAIFSYVIYRGANMQYEIKSGKLYIKGVMKNHEIALTNITSVEKITIPRFGMRLFGASGFGGYYRFKDIGNAWLSSGNAKDGVLLKTRNKKQYILAPKRHAEFIKAIAPKSA